MRKVLFTLVFCLWAGMYQIQAQDLIIPKHGEPIKAYNIEISDKYYFYTKGENNETELMRIAKDSVLMVRKADGSVLENNNTTINKLKNSSYEKEVKDYPIIKDEDIHGSLIAEGNKVFIPTNSSAEYVRAGQEVLKELVTKSGYWTVVDDLEQAHFVLQFGTSTSGRDFSFIAIRPRKYYRGYPDINVSLNALAYSYNKYKQLGIMGVLSWSNESIDDNKIVARSMFNQMYAGITNKESAFYTNKRLVKVLDADAKSNNYANDMGYCVYFNLQ